MERSMCHSASSSNYNITFEFKQLNFTHHNPVIKFQYLNQQLNNAWITNREAKITNKIPLIQYQIHYNGTYQMDGHNHHPSHQNDPSFQDMQVAPESSLSPQQATRHPHSFYSPYRIRGFLEPSKTDALSPDFFLEFSHSFKRIMENQHEESSENGQSIDIMGNRIHEFDSPFEIQEQGQVQLPTIVEDKENELPHSYLATPLKMKHRELRSPLQDITPSMTHKKKKTNSKFSVSEKARLMTPKTMQKSRLASSGMQRGPRF